MSSLKRDNWDLNLNLSIEVNNYVFLKCADVIKLINSFKINDWGLKSDTLTVSED